MGSTTGPAQSLDKLLMVGVQTADKKDKDVGCMLSILRV